MEYIRIFDQFKCFSNFTYFMFSSDDIWEIQYFKLITYIIGNMIYKGGESFFIRINIVPLCRNKSSIQFVFIFSVKCLNLVFLFSNYSSWLQFAYLIEIKIKFYILILTVFELSIMHLFAILVRGKNNLTYSQIYSQFYRKSLFQISAVYPYP